MRVHQPEAEVTRDLLQRLGWWLVYRTSRQGDDTEGVGPYEVRGNSALKVKDTPRSFFSWAANDPTPEDAPPFMFLVVDSLQIGRKVVFHLSPKQAYMLCEYGLDSIRKQAQAFDYDEEEPPDYDVRDWALRYRDIA